ncbi:MAG: transglutaminase-like domain-containing protein [Desulfobacteraceae bacterium]|nr:transglutaminase-like domain-containing protein [Desulfobacteraceae bacterium]
MKISKNKCFWITGTLAFLAFMLLLMIRLDLLNKFLYRPRTLVIPTVNLPHAKETWMNIFQGNRKIGFSHTQLSAENEGYHLQETVLMRINTMGMVQNIQLKTRGRLKDDYSLADFDFNINSGQFSFGVAGSLTGDVLAINTASGGSTRRMEIKLENKPYLLAGITSALATVELKAGDKYAFDIFDPATMGQTPVIIEVIGKEDVGVAGSQKSATRVSLNFKGTSQTAWIDESGDVLQEKGILGIRLEKTTRQDALGELGRGASTDLTEIASIAFNVMLTDPDRLATLKFEIKGITDKRVRLNGGRQNFENNTLTVIRESTEDLPDNIELTDLDAFEKIYLQSSAFIQSDHQNIQNLARKIVADQNTSLEKVRALVDWVHRNIEKRPVLSLPDALSTLENRVGDCNEHAVLFAALARAAGIPCRLEAGLVYLKGRFYYHAWNLVYLGRWITVDSLFGQIPADVSHIRLVAGSPQQQLDLMGLIGKLQLKVIE